MWNVLQTVNRNPWGKLELESRLCTKALCPVLKSFEITGVSKCFAVCRHQEWNLWNWTVYNTQATMPITPFHDIQTSFTKSQCSATDKIQSSVKGWCFDKSSNENRSWKGVSGLVPACAFSFREFPSVLHFHVCSSMKMSIFVFAKMPSETWQTGDVRFCCQT